MTTKQAQEDKLQKEWEIASESNDMKTLKDLRDKFEALELADDSEFLPVGTTLVMSGIPYKRVGRAMSGDHKLVRWIKSKRAWAKTPQIWIGKGSRA